MTKLIVAFHNFENALKPTRYMLYGEIITICKDHYTKHQNAFCS